MTKTKSIAQVRLVLGVSDSTIRRILRRCELRAYRVGRQWRITESDLDAFLAARANRPANELADQIATQQQPTVRPG